MRFNDIQKETLYRNLARACQNKKLKYDFCLDELGDIINMRISHNNKNYYVNDFDIKGLTFLIKVEDDNNFKAWFGVKELFNYIIKERI